MSARPYLINKINGCSIKVQIFHQASVAHFERMQQVKNDGHREFHRHMAEDLQRQAAIETKKAIEMRKLLLILDDEIRKGTMQ